MVSDAACSRMTAKVQLAPEASVPPAVGQVLLRMLLPAPVRIKGVASKVANE